MPNSGLQRDTSIWPWFVQVLLVGEHAGAKDLTDRTLTEAGALRNKDIVALVSETQAVSR